MQVSLGRVASPCDVDVERVLYDVVALDPLRSAVTIQALHEAQANLRHIQQETLCTNKINMHV